MTKDNITLISEFVKIFTDGIFIFMLLHVIYFIFAIILSRQNPAFLMCAAVFVITGTYSIYSASSFELRGHFVVAYILSYIVYRNSLYYLTNDILVWLFRFAGKIFTLLIFPIIKASSEIYSSAQNTSKKVRKKIYTLLQRSKKVYNKYKSLFITEKRNERKKEQKTETG